MATAFSECDSVRQQTPYRSTQPPVVVARGFMPSTARPVIVCQDVPGSSHAAQVGIASEETDFHQIVFYCARDWLFRLVTSWRTHPVTFSRALMVQSYIRPAERRWSRRKSLDGSVEMRGRKRAGAHWSRPHFCDRAVESETSIPQNRKPQDSPGVIL